MQRPLLRPSEVIQQLDAVFRHLRSRIPQERLVRLAHTSIIEYKACVSVAPVVTEVFGLPLPGCLERAETHEPLTTSAAKQVSFRSTEIPSLEPLHYTYHQMDRSMAMNLVRDLERPPATLGDRDCASLIRGQIPTDMLELRVLYDLCRGKGRPTHSHLSAGASNAWEAPSIHCLWVVGDSPDCAAQHIYTFHTSCPHTSPKSRCRGPTSCCPTTPTAPTED